MQFLCTGAVTSGVAGTLFERLAMKKVIDSSPPTPYWMLKDAGIYDVQSSSDDANEWWIDIEVFMDKGKLWFINPYNDKLVAVKGMHGWLFRRRKNAMEALPTHHTTAALRSQGQLPAATA